MPLILDNLVIFLVLAVARWIWRYRSETWLMVEGQVVSAKQAPLLYDCALVKYEYKVEDVTYQGSYRRGYLFSPSRAQFLAECFSQLKAISVRYNPANLATSYLAEEDQAFSTRQREGF